MNKIELILDNSVFTVDQFTSAQIATLNEMVTDNISIDQVCIIAHPSVNELSYSILYEYLTKGNSITSKEYQKYLNIDVDRINDMIINVYLGKLHGLTEDQINLYAQKSVFNIKIARLLVEKSKDASPEQLKQLVSGKFGTKSIAGKQAIQDYINNEISLEQLLALTYCENLDQSDYEYIKSADSRTLSIVKDYYKTSTKTVSLSKSGRIKQSLNIDNNSTCVSTAFGPDDTYLHFDSLETYNKFVGICDTVYNTNNKYWTDYAEKLYNCYKNDFTSNNNFIKLYEYMNRIYYLDSKNIIDNSSFSCILMYYFDDRCINNYGYVKRLYSQEFSSFDEYLEVFMNTDGFRNYIKAKWIDKVSEEDLNFIKQGKSYLDMLFDLYKTKKDKETEIPYLEEHLKFAAYDQIHEVICMKENKCSNDEIHFYIENYLSKTNCLPSMYFDKDKDYSKYWNISEFLKINDSDMNLDYLYIIKSNCSDEDEQFIIDNKLRLYSGYYSIQKDLINMFKDYGASNIQYAYETYISHSEEVTKKIIENYNYAKSIFKDKVKCIGYYISEDRYKISEHLVKYIDNFDDDTLRYILGKGCLQRIEFCLKMSVITTDYNILINMYDDAEIKPYIDTFNEKDEKVTKDVVIQLSKDAKFSIPEDLFKDQAELAIGKSVDYFGSSKNFKPIQYDDETIYIDIIGNKELKGSHIITFNKEDDNYEYIFEIAHKDDTLNYSAKISTKKDVKDCISKSIALIENIDEYSEYVTELQDLLKSI